MIRLLMILYLVLTPQNREEPQYGHILLFLPAYSPDLTPIEQYWAIIKAKIKKYISGYSDLYSCIEFVFQTI